MLEGFVRDWNERGWGFLVYPDPVDGRMRCVFAHYSAICGQGERYRSLQVGQRVSFTVVEDSRGKHAEQVQVLPNEGGECA